MYGLPVNNRQKRSGAVIEFRTTLDGISPDNFFLNISTEYF